MSKVTYFFNSVVLIPTNDLCYTLFNKSFDYALRSSVFSGLSLKLACKLNTIDLLESACAFLHMIEVYDLHEQSWSRGRVGGRADFIFANTNCTCGAL